MKVTVKHRTSDPVSTFPRFIQGTDTGAIYFQVDVHWAYQLNGAHGFTLRKGMISMSYIASGSGYEILREGTILEIEL